MSNVNLADATTIVDTGLAHGRKIDCNPLTIVVLDAGGHVVAVKREDNSAIMRPQVAHGKAWGALAMGMSSRALEGLALKRPHFVGALSDLSGGRLVPVAGGVLIRDASARIVGAVGVSGDTSDRDEECAVAGIEAAGLQADTGRK